MHRYNSKYLRIKYLDIGIILLLSYRHYFKLNE